MRYLTTFVSAIVALSFSFVASARDDVNAVIRYEARHHPTYDTDGMVASRDYLASRIGAEVLARGGNAVDAAIATGFALAVVAPIAGNIGGGGFMLVHWAETGETFAFDYREMAPPGATRDMFLDENGDVDSDRAQFSHLSAAVPGSVAGLWLAHQELGSLPWEDLVTPAMKLARDGFVVDFDIADRLIEQQDRLSKDPSSVRYFFKDGGKPYEPGDLLVQADLGRTLEKIAEQGPDGFYKGEVAKLIAAEMAANGGLIDEASLAAYKPEIKTAIEGSYRGYDILAMPPPSSGGVHVLQMLNILENFPVAELGAGTADNIHLLAEVCKLAFADRSEHLGDPDFHDVPIAWLTSKDYARELADGIDMQRARPSVDIRPGVPAIVEGPDTTHISVMDASGNVVSNTTTLNFSYGSGLSVDGAGFLLNNQMDDFVSKPGVPNGYGLVGGKANAIEPGKRPLSSMTPVIVLEDGKPVLATGSPGGSRIITAVLQMLVNVLDHGMNIADAASVPRMHHQWSPDTLELESGFSLDVYRELERRGHTMESSETSGNLHSVAYRDGRFRGWSDARRPGGIAVGPGSLQNQSQD